MRWASTGLDSTPVRILLLGLVIYLVWRPATRTGGLVAALAWPLANLATDIAKARWPIPRPGNVVPDAIVRIGMSDSMGTASAHAANMMFIATVFLFYFRWWGLPWFLFALLVGYSRVFLAAHTPAQVVLGWALGAFIAWMTCQTVEAGRRLVRSHRERGAPPDPTEAAP